MTLTSRAAAGSPTAWVSRLCECSVRRMRAGSADLDVAGRDQVEHGKEVRRAIPECEERHARRALREAVQVGTRHKHT